MLERILATCRRFAHSTTKSSRRKRTAILDIGALEKRATPAVDMGYSVEPAEMVAVAEVDAASPIVRLDLMPAGSSTSAAELFAVDEILADSERSDDAIAGTDQQPETNPAEGEVLVTEADLQYAKLTEEYRRYEA